MLTATEAHAVEAAVARVEARTGVQVVAAVVDQAHSYPQLRWKAFALAATLAALAVVVADVARPDWFTGYATLLHSVAILGAGAAAALLAVFVRPFARIFLRGPRRDFETRRRAQALFLEREMFATRARHGVLLMVCVFERQVEIVADRGYGGRVDERDWNRVIAAMRPALARGKVAAALQEGLGGIEALLVAKGFAGGNGDGNELPDALVQQRGAR
jgi:putative membrane protein